MKHRILRVLLAVSMIIMLTTSTVCAYNIDDHWANDFINKEFYQQYIQEYSGDINEKLLDQQMEERLYQRTLNEILRDVTGEIVENRIDASKVEIISIWENNLNRKSLATYTVKQLKEYKVDLLKNVKTSEIENKMEFKDLQDLEKNEIEAIKILYNADILNGYDKETYGPNDKVTYAQGIIILQRLELEIKNQLESEQDIDTSDDNAKETKASSDQKKESDDEKINSSKDSEDTKIDHNEDRDKVSNEKSNDSKTVNSSGNKNIKFKVIKGEASAEGFLPKLVKDKTTGKSMLRLYITKSFDYQGSYLSVNKILLDKEGIYQIYLKINTPKLKDLTLKESILDTIVIVIEESDLGVETLNGAPLNFKLNFD